MKFVLIVLITQFATGASSAPPSGTLQMFEVVGEANCKRLGEAIQKRWAGHRRAVDVLCEPKGAQ